MLSAIFLVGGLLAVIAVLAVFAVVVTFLPRSARKVVTTTAVVAGLFVAIAVAGLVTVQVADNPSPRYTVRDVNSQPVDTPGLSVGPNDLHGLFRPYGRETQADAQSGFIRSIRPEDGGSDDPSAADEDRLADAGPRDRDASSLEDDSSTPPPDAAGEGDDDIVLSMTRKELLDTIRTVVVEVERIRRQVAEEEEAISHHGRAEAELGQTDPADAVDGLALAEAAATEADAPQGAAVEAITRALTRAVGGKSIQRQYESSRREHERNVAVQKLLADGRGSLDLPQGEPVDELLNRPEPSWVGAPAGPGDEGYVQTVTVGPYYTPQEIQDHFDGEVEQAARTYTDEYLQAAGSTKIRLPRDFVRTHVVRESYDTIREVDFGPSVGLQPMLYRHGRLVFDDAANERIDELWHAEMLQGRLVRASALFVSLLGVMSTGWFYLRTARPGRDSVWRLLPLRAGVAAAILAICAVNYLIFS